MRGIQGRDGNVCQVVYATPKLENNRPGIYAQARIVGKTSSKGCELAAILADPPQGVYKRRGAFFGSGFLVFAHIKG